MSTLWSKELILCLTTNYYQLWGGVLLIIFSLFVVGCDNGSSDSGTSNTTTSKSYTITFHSNGGTGNMQEVTISGTEPLPVCTFTREGFAFSGWNTKADGSGTRYADKGYCTPKEDMTLYAQWDEPKASVTTTSGTTSYATLAAALAAAPSGSTITLKANSTTPAIGLTITKSITLDLNGCTIEAASDQSESLLVVAEQGSLTIKDSRSRGKITLSKPITSNSGTIKNEGKLTINGGTIENTGTESKSYAICSLGGTVTINGGTITSDSANAINKNSSIGGKMTLSVTGGTISSTNADAIVIGSGDAIAISGGTISSREGAAIKSNVNDGTATISGGTITSSGTYAISGLDIILSGAPTIKGKNADICLKSYYSDWKNNKIAGKLTITDQLKITDGESSTKLYAPTPAVFTAGTGYTITPNDVSKLSFVDSTGAPYKNGSFTYSLELKNSSVSLKQDI